MHCTPCASNRHRSPIQQPALRDHVAKAVRRYLLDLGDCDSHDLYDIVLREIEMPMLAEVMRHCEGNQSRAAATLGLNRATLRKKLKAYGLELSPRPAGPRPDGYNSPPRFRGFRCPPTACPSAGRCCPFPTRPA